MSWSYFKNGTAEAVKADAAVALENSAKGCDNIPAEALAIRSFAQALDAACDAAAGQAMKVAASGTAWLDDGKLRSFNFKADVEVIDLGA